MGVALMASYHYYAMNHNARQEQRSKIVKMISEYDLYDSFDAFAFRGLSGALFAVGLAEWTNKGLIYVRKDGERCHGGRIEASMRDGCASFPTYYHNMVPTPVRYVIVDDHVDSGKTVRKIQRALDKDLLAGIILYGMHSIAGDLRKKLGHLLGRADFFILSSVSKEFIASDQDYDGENVESEWRVHGEEHGRKLKDTILDDPILDLSSPTPVADAFMQGSGLPKLPRSAVVWPQLPPPKFPFLPPSEGTFYHD